MEYLVTMTTHVPDGTPEQGVAEVRGREAARSRELAAQGRLLRLWRPPLRPGEWRTLGLFSADGADALEETLASMPLRIWRSDQVTELQPHPNDPADAAIGVQPASSSAAMQFLVTLTIRVPPGTPDALVAETKAREAQRAQELAGQGHLLRLWTPAAAPGEWRILGLWSAADPDEMQDILSSLPLYPWTTVETTPLRAHPNDPASGDDHG